VKAEPLHRSDREIIADLRASLDALESTVGLAFGIYGDTRVRLGESITRDLEALCGEPVAQNVRGKEIESIKRMLRDVEFEVRSSMREIDSELTSIRSAVEDL
jgi:hypothetical protein